MGVVCALTARNPDLPRQAAILHSPLPDAGSPRDGVEARTSRSGRTNRRARGNPGLSRILQW